MRFASCITVLIASLSLSEGFILDSVTSPRSVTKTLTVDNGRRWGNWTQPEFCANGSYAVGYNMKTEEYRFFKDDSKLNGIELYCETPAGQMYGKPVVSGEGTLGEWFTDVTSCEGTTPQFFSSFSLQVEDDQGPVTDDTAANYVRFHCRDLMANVTGIVVARPPGQGQFGSYGKWSDTCDVGTAICGLQTKIDLQADNSDYTGLNDVRMFCCS